MINKLIWPVVLLACVVLIGVIFAINVFGVRNRVDSFSPGDKFEVLIGQKTRKLASKNNFLNIVMLRMKNPGIVNDGAFNFQLIDEGGDVVRQLDFHGMNIGDPGDLRFQFEPITDSAGKEYEILITADDSQPTVSIDVNKDSEIAYTSYFRTVNKSLAIASFVNLLGERISTNFGIFIFWIFILFGILIYDLKKK